MNVAELRDTVTEWAAEHHGDELFAAMKLFLGPRKPEGDALASAASFAVVSAPADGVSLVRRYADLPRQRSRAERVLLDVWRRSRFALYRVADVAVDRWLDLHDVGADRAVRVSERAGTHQIVAGDWLAAFTFEQDGRVVIEGSSMLVVRHARIHAVQAALAYLASCGTDPDDPLTTQRLSRPVIHAIYQASRRPRFVNTDGHDIRMFTITVGVPWARVQAVVSAWPDADADEGAVLLVADDAGDRVTRARFDRQDGRVVLLVNSVERRDEVLTRWASATGEALPVVSEEVETVPSDPLGPALVADMRAVALPAGTTPDEVAAGYMRDRDRAWVDESIPALGGLTPRAAVEAGRTAEVWALMMDDERSEAIVAELGLEVGR